MTGLWPGDIFGGSSVPCMWDRPEAGASHFAMAAKLRAEVDETFIQVLTHHLLNYENQFGAEATQAVLNRLIPYLEQIGDYRGARRLQGSYSINRAFQSYRVGSHAPGTRRGYAGSCA